MIKYEVFFRGYALGYHVFTQEAADAELHALYLAHNRTGIKHGHVTVHRA